MFSVSQINQFGDQSIGGSVLFLLFIIFCIGASIGSFLNVLIDRLPQNKSVGGRSHCDYCKKQLAWYDLFPIVSYLLLRGQCRYCQRKISRRYVLMELGTGIVFVLVFAYIPYWFIPDFLTISVVPLIIRFIYLVLISSLIVIFFSDIQYHIIPDSMQVGVLVSSIIITMTNSTNVISSVLPMIISGAAIAAPILLLYLVTRGKGMGFGDVKLSLSIGILFGIPLGIAVLYMAFISGALIGIISILRGKSHLNSKIAFGPFLIVGMIIALFFHQQIVNLIHFYFPLGL